jgi:hypothetical protein
MPPRGLQGDGEISFSEADDGLRSLSFIIPARNEEEGLGETLTAIQEEVPPSRLADVIVVDNGSTDATVDVAQGLSARVVKDESASSIGTLRNVGARQATGDVLVFLDADVSLGPGWNTGLQALDSLLDESADVVTGSWCEPPADATWIAKVWNAGMHERSDVRHIGSGHLVVPRETFFQMGGFDPTLPTGEDYELCRRAKSMGIAVVAVPGLRAIHRGEPRRLREFFRREVWHGLGDSGSLKQLLQSHVAMAAAFFVALHVVAILPLITPLPTEVSIAGLVGVVGLVGVAAVVRRRSISLLRWAQMSALIYLYFWARFVALIARVGNLSERRSVDTLRVRRN